MISFLSRNNQQSRIIPSYWLRSGRFVRQVMDPRFFSFLVFMGRKLRALVIKGGKNSVHNLLYRPRTRLTRGVSRLPPVLFVFLSCCFLCVWFFFGLQDSLNKLSQYCQNWFLNIANKRIEIVNDYTYLGVNFSSNGSFIRHKEKLQEKTRCSIFAFRRYADPSKLSFLKRLQQTF